MTTTQAKTCIVCQQDVSAKPRSKDAHGRYVCKECEAKAVATGAAKRAAEAAPVAKSEPSVAAKPAPSGGFDLFADVPQPCPSCSAPMKNNASVCTICGFNKETGQALKTRVLAAPKERKVRGQGSKVSISPDHLAMGLIVVMIGLGAVGLFMPEMAAILYIISVVVWYAVWVCGIVCAFRDGDTRWGVIGILGAVSPVVIAFWVYLMFLSERPLIKLLTIAATIGALSAGTLLFLHGKDADEADRAAHPVTEPAAAPTPSLPKKGK